MSHPVPCGHNTEYCYNRVAEDLTIVPATPPTDATETPYGITPTQLRAVLANVRRRCLAEKWVDREGVPLTTANVTTYDMYRYVILPFTLLHDKSGSKTPSSSKGSFVEALPSTMGHQPPRWYVVHRWGGGFEAFVECIERFLEDSRYGSESKRKRGGGLTADTPLYVWAYAHDLWNGEGGVEGKEAVPGVWGGGEAVGKAMEAAEYRMLTVLDGADGGVWDRIWFLYELTLAFRYGDEHDNAGDLMGVGAGPTDDLGPVAVGYVGEEGGGEGGVISGGVGGFELEMVVLSWW